MSSEMNLFLGSAAEVIKPGIVKIITSKNPEEIFVEGLSAFIQDIGYSEVMPNFDTVNVGTVSPFAQMLYQEIQGQKVSFEAFPAITIADIDQTESEMVLSDHVVDAVFDAASLAWLVAEKDAGRIFIADSNITKLEIATAGGNELSSVRRTATRQSTFVFSIWTQNKEVTSLLFDITGAFLLDKKIAMHEQDVDIFQASGSRSGDINMEFGAILYGASYRVDTRLHKTVMTIDADSGVVSDVTVVVSDDSATGQIAHTDATLTKS